VLVAGEVFNYAGCSDTLAKCLGEGIKDPHALRMTALVKQLLKDGYPPDKVIHGLEKYYASFAPRERQKLRADNCAVYGKAKARVVLVEFSDYQCPHCAAALPFVTALVNVDRKDQVRLCSKYFPFSSHPRARIAALCLHHGVRELWTADRDFSVFPQLKTRNPLVA